MKEGLLPSFTLPPMKNQTTRKIICDDAHNWLKSNKNNLAIITSLPDMEEIGIDKNNWIEWIKETCLLLSDSLNENGIIFFYQTDRKYKGEVIDKKSIISNVFFSLGYKNIFSKIVLKQEPNTINLFRPTYTNLFAFSKNVKSGKTTADVIHAGKMIYKNAMGLNACRVSIDFIKTKIDTDIIIDPFCGQGSVLKISNDMGFNSIGVEILKEQCDKAKKL